MTSPNLEIRASDSRCRAVGEEGKPLTSWYADALTVLAKFRQKQAAKDKKANKHDRTN